MDSQLRDPLSRGTDSIRSQILVLGHKLQVKHAAGLHNAVNRSVCLLALNSEMVASSVDFPIKQIHHKYKKGYDQM